MNFRRWLPWPRRCLCRYGTDPCPNRALWYGAGPHGRLCPACRAVCVPLELGRDPFEKYNQAGAGQ